MIKFSNIQGNKDSQSESLIILPIKNEEHEKGKD